MSRPPARFRSPFFCSPSAARAAGSLTAPARPCTGVPFSNAAWPAVVPAASNTPAPTRQPVAVLRFSCWMLAKPQAPLRLMPPGESHTRLVGPEKFTSLSMKLPAGLVTAMNTFGSPPVFTFTPVIAPRVSKAAKR